MPPSSTGAEQRPFNFENSENQLLSRLDTDSISRLRSHLHPILLNKHDILFRPNASIRHVYFPETAVACLLTVMEDGRSVEAATVGREGALWISASISAPSMPCQTMVTVGGKAWRIAIQHVEDEIRRNGSFHHTLTRYSHALLIQAMRTGSCNALHSLEERCARWMLTTLDRTDEGCFVVTHEYLANLIGCARPVLTRILLDLAKGGGIELHRGSIHVLNREHILARSCECYEIIRRNHLPVETEPAAISYASATEDLHPQ